MSSRFLLLALVLVVSGCGRFPFERAVSAERATGPAARITYQCESGTAIEASYPSDSTAIVEYGKHTLRMTLAVSASGARYVGGGLVWWTKGTGPGAEGTLFRYASDATGEMLEQCVWSKSSE